MSSRQKFDKKKQEFDQVKANEGQIIKDIENQQREHNTAQEKFNQINQEATRLQGEFNALTEQLTQVESDLNAAQEDLSEKKLQFPKSQIRFTIS